MAHSYDELMGMTVAQLRDVAQDVEHDAVHGYSTMHKHELLHALCIALGLEEHVHHDVVGIDKSGIKRQIKELKQKRDAALEAHDAQQLKQVRRKLHRLKRRIHAATV